MQKLALLLVLAAAPAYALPETSTLSDEDYGRKAGQWKLGIGYEGEIGGFLVHPSFAPSIEYQLTDRLSVGLLASFLPGVDHYSNWTIAPTLNYLFWKESRFAAFFTFGLVYNRIQASVPNDPYGNYLISRLGLLNRLGFEYYLTPQFSVGTAINVKSYFSTRDRGNDLTGSADVAVHF